MHQTETSQDMCLYTLRLHYNVGVGVHVKTPPFVS